MIKHILKDGTVVSTVAGRKITADEFPMIYKIIEAINERNNNNVRKIRNQRLA